MKKTGVIVLLLLAAVLLTACGSDKPAATEAPAVTETPAVTEAPAAADAASVKTLSEAVEAAAKDAADLAPFLPEELEDMAGITAEDYTDFVFLQGDGMDGREILVIRAKDEAAADRVAGQMESYLERRREEHKNYAPDAYRLLSEAKVERKGLLLVMVSGTDAAAGSAAILAGE